MRFSKEDLGGALAAAALLLATPLTLWIFAANPPTAAALGSRLALGLSPDRFGAELRAGSELLERADRFFQAEDPPEEMAARVRQDLLRARAHFERAAGQAQGPEQAARARQGWGGADLRLARWALVQGKGGGLLRRDDEDLFRWGLAYAREGLALPDLDARTRAGLEELEDRLARELTWWR